MRVNRSIFMAMEFGTGIFAAARSSGAGLQPYLSLLKQREAALSFDADDTERKLGGTVEKLFALKQWHPRFWV
jgi:hypothetical protein